jgi:hypothetical protein
VPTSAPAYDSVKDFYFKEYYSPVLDAIVSEMEVRFDSVVQASLVALQHVVMSKSTDDESMQATASKYGLDVSLLKAERDIVLNMDFDDDRKPQAERNAFPSLFSGMSVMAFFLFCPISRNL